MKKHKFFIFTSFFFSLLSFGPNCLWGEESQPLFPFVVSYDSLQNITNLSSCLDAPAGKHGFVRVENGKLATDAGPIRFWGTNLCFDANFPSADQVDQFADRLARFGFNCIRLHHMDTGNDSLVTGNPNTLTELNATKLDNLDRLVAALKKRGVYVNINLHVGRWLDEKDGFTDKEKRPNYDKGIGNFEPRMIELQMKYAKDLLTHVNPYTKLSYAKDPCVAIVEISNEDSIIQEWFHGKLPHLPDPYHGALQRLWNQWLRDKYETDDNLKKAWNFQDHEIGEEMFQDGDFNNDQSLVKGHLAWHPDEQSQSEIWIDEGILKIKLAQKGNIAWLPQLYYRPCRVEENSPYTVFVKIRASKETKMSVRVDMDHEPWGLLGVRSEFTVTPQWQTLTIPFYASENDEKARLTVSGFQSDTNYEIDYISMKPGGAFGLDSGQTLEAGNIPLVSPGYMNGKNEMSRDFTAFLRDIEQDYWCGMYDYIKNELDVQSPVIGTQLNYGSTHIQAKLDFCDNHSYWNHPVFTEKDWDLNHWYISNRALVNHMDAGTLTGLAACRVAGKPYTISEYDHPFPNFYSAEGGPMIAAFGRFQKWDGIFPFAYSHSSNLVPNHVGSFFDMVANVGDLVHASACYNMFVRGDISEADETYTLGMDQDQEIDILLEKHSPWSIRWSGLKADERLALQHAVAIDLDGQTSPHIPEIPKDQKVFSSDTGEIHVDMSKPNHGTMTVVSENSKLFTGFIPEGPLKLGNVSLEFGKTNLGWATLTLTTLEGTGLGENGQPARLLLAVTGECKNTDMNVQHLPENRITLGKDFGKGPVLCEGIPATLWFQTEKDRIKVYPLDPSGNRKKELPIIAVSDQESRVSIGPESQTVWYEIMINEYRGDEKN